MKSTMHRFDDAGLRNVWLLNGYKIVKTPYGLAVSYHDLDGLTRTICAALVKKSGRLTGVEFRYLRLHLRFSQNALARILGNTEQSVANWEKKGRVPLWADKHLRILWQAAR
jgi:DNA-binding transcriptional regulator YiaG